MPQHLIAWSESIAQNAENDLAPVVDPIIRINNNHFVLPSDQSMFWLYVCSANIDSARLSLPSFRQVALPYQTPVSVGPNPITNQNFISYLANPLKIAAREELALLATQVGAGAEFVTGIACIGTRNPPVPAGQQYCLRGTGATAAVAHVWTQTTVTWSDSLPEGEYAVIGIEGISTTQQAVRLMFLGQEYRPGSLAKVAAQNRLPLAFEEKMWGVLGTFRQDQMPNVEVLCNAADATQVFYLKVVKVR